jgi:hypothetical protein
MQIRLSKGEVRAINHHHLPLSRQAVSFYGKVLMNGKKFSRYYVAYLQKGDSDYHHLTSSIDEPNRRKPAVGVYIKGFLLIMN